MWGVNFRSAPLDVGRIPLLFPFLDFFDFLYLLAVVCEMIKVATYGAREFGSVRVGIVLTFLAKAANIMVLVMIMMFFPSFVSLGVRGYVVYFLTMGVSAIAALVFTFIVSRRWVSIIQLLKGMYLLCRHWLCKVNSSMCRMSHGEPLWIWKCVIWIV